MVKLPAGRVALTGLCVATIIGLAGACGVRPTAAVGEPVIVPPATPTVTVSSSAPVPVPSTTTEDPPPGRTNPAGTQPIDGKKLVAAAQSVEANTTLGAVVFDRVAGTELLSIEADRRFHSASLVKLLIAIDALHRGASAAERREITRMLSMSDDTIASAMWVEAGGPRLVTRSVRLIGLTGTEPPDVYGRWGETTLTAHDMVLVYQYVMDGLPREDHVLVVDALARATEYGADDFRQYFGIPDGLSAQWAIKQGWGNNDHTMVLHSTGLVGPKWRYVVVLLTEHPLGSGWKTCTRSVTAVAEALNQQLPA
jgi:hypothetical protein